MVVCGHSGPDMGHGMCRRCYQSSDYFRASRVRYRTRIRLAAIAFLGGVCVRCGIDDERVLQFDHIDGSGRYEKKRSDTWYLSVVRDDRKDLQLLCANCHVIKTRESGEYS